MVTLTDAVVRELDAYFADKPKSPIRIHLAMGGCSGPRLSLSLDEPGEGDQVFTPNGYTVVVEKELCAKASPMTVTMGPGGFGVESPMELPKGGGCGCGSGGGSGGCGGGSGGGCAC